MTCLSLARTLTFPPLSVLSLSVSVCLSVSHLYVVFIEGNLLLFFFFCFFFGRGMFAVVVVVVVFVVLFVSASFCLVCMFSVVC